MTVTTKPLTETDGVSSQESVTVGWLKLVTANEFDPPCAVTQSSSQPASRPGNAASTTRSRTAKKGRGDLRDSSSCGCAMTGLLGAFWSAGLANSFEKHGLR